MSEQILQHRRRRFWLLIAVAIAGIALVAIGARAADCGSERWAVKVGTDPDVGRVNTTPIDTTVADLRELEPPDDIRHFEGRAPAELQIYTVDATLTLFKTEGDSDRHLVLRDKGATIIAETADPDCADGSPWQEYVAQVREAFDARFHGHRSAKKLRVRVRITGPAFFDFIHGQTGVAPNGIEIHPILAIEFLR